MKKIMNKCIKCSADLVEKDGAWVCPQGCAQTPEAPAAPAEPAAV